MKEPDRKARNTQRLGECHPLFRARVLQVIGDLEGQGFRPRIQDGWRSKQDQLAAFNSGHSQLRFGYHNVTGPQGEKMSLAVDMLDDDHPLDASTRYVLALAIAAGDHGLTTGVLWTKAGQPPLTATAKAIKERNIEADVRVGWDPCHVQANGVTLAQAEVADFSGLA